MADGRNRYIDEELDSAIEKIEVLGNFTTRKEASRRAGKILNTALDELGDTIREEMENELKAQDGDGSDGDDFFRERGFDSSMLGFDS